MKPMFTSIAAAAALSIACAGLVGCGAAQPPRELVDARVAYQQASQSPGSYAAQSDVFDAKRALDRAEASFDDHPSSDETRDLAYIAQRKALSAQAKAGAMYSVEQKKTAENEIVSIQNEERMAMRSELERAKGQLGSKAGELDSERRAREAADAKTREALDKIAGLKAEEQERGLVLTLSGNVLFPFAKSTLLPNSKKSLNAVADVIKEGTSSIRIVGHTDSVGSEETNMELSRKRAEAVKQQLVSRGVASRRIETEGMGKAAPIADNATPEGRANNRRVEIVIEKVVPRTGTSGGGMDNNMNNNNMKR